MRMKAHCKNCKWVSAGWLSRWIDSEEHASLWNCNHPELARPDYISGKQGGPSCCGQNVNGDCEKYEARWSRKIPYVDHDHEGEEPIFSQYLGGSDGLLAPCPFCGNEDLRVLECSERSQPGVGPCWLVKCDCVEGPSSDTRDEAINKWNRRGEE